MLALSRPLFMRLFPVATVALSTGLVGCEEITTDPEVPKQAALEAFVAANPVGRASVELGGRNVWLEAGMFEPSCLESKDLAFNDEPQGRPSGSPPRISPTYAAQRYITGTSERGVCVVLGDNLTATAADVTFGGEDWVVSLDVSVDNPTPWFECLLDKHKHPQVHVKIGEDGVPAVQDDPKLLQGGCSPDLPADVTRKGGDNPSSKAKSAPTKAEVKELVTQLDKALYDADFQAARELTSCINLFEKPVYGACSLGEFVSMGPSFQGEVRGRDGTPWVEYTVKSPDDFGRIVRDRTDPSMFHVTMTHKRTGKPRSFTVQRADGAWKVLGIVSQKAEALTTVRIMNDLHDRTKRDILDRRLKGEAIDHNGDPTEEER